MITLYRKKTSETADEIEARFKELTLAYRIEVLPETSRVSWLVEDAGNKIDSHRILDEWMAQLEKELNWQRSLTGDGCYIDPETGRVC